MRVEPGAVVLTAAPSSRAGWAEAAARRTATGLPDALSATRSGDEEWMDGVDAAARR